MFHEPRYRAPVEEFPTTQALGDYELRRSIDRLELGLQILRVLPLTSEMIPETIPLGLIVPNNSLRLAPNLTPIELLYRETHTCILHFVRKQTSCRMQEFRKMDGQDLS